MFGITFQILWQVEAANKRIREGEEEVARVAALLSETEAAGKASAADAAERIAKLGEDLTAREKEIQESRLSGDLSSQQLSDLRSQIEEAEAQGTKEREAKVEAERQVELLSSKVDLLGKDSAAAAESASSGYGHS